MVKVRRNDWFGHVESKAWACKERCQELSANSILVSSAMAAASHCHQQLSEPDVAAAGHRKHGREYGLVPNSSH